MKHVHPVTVLLHPKNIKHILYVILKANRGRALNLFHPNESTEKNHTSSTFWAVFADVSMKIKPFSLANCSPSSVLTARRCARSHLFPISMMVIFELAWLRASSNQLAK